MLTLLVDNLPFDNPGDTLHNFLESLNAYPTVKFTWGRANKKIAERWVENNLAQIVPVKQFQLESHPNPVYVIVVHTIVEFLNTTVWDLIPESTKEILQSHNIPILVMHPLEISGYPIDCYSNFIIKKRHVGLWANQVLFLSLSTYTNLDGSNTTLSKMRGFDLHEASIIPSINFLNFYSAAKTRRASHIQYVEGLPTDLNKKKFNCLILNNQMRANRSALCQALYSAGIWGKNIISHRYPSPDGHNFNMMLQCIIAHEREYLQSDILKEAIVNLPLSNVTEADDVTNFVNQLISDCQSNNIFPQQILPDDTTDEADDINHWANGSWYEKTWCSVITETYSNPLMGPAIDSPAITEKTAKPLANLHPFVIFGAGGQHKLLRSFGFKTFEQTWFNLPEDHALGNRTFIERLFNLTKSLVDMSNTPHSVLAARWNGIKDDLIFNRNHLMNTDWYKVQVNLILREMLRPPY